MPCNSDSVGDTHGRGCREASRRTVPQKTNRPSRGNVVGVRVKRCGKSAPREAQATRHGKPHRVQGQIGNLRSGPLQSARKRDGFRVLAAKTNDSLPGAIRADRNRLTALPKPFHFRVGIVALRRVAPRAAVQGLYGLLTPVEIVPPVYRGRACRSATSAT